MTIYSANHNYNSSKTIPYDKIYVERKVTIGDGVWIGMGSVVTKDVKEGEIVVSSIQKTIKKRT